MRIIAEKENKPIFRKEYTMESMEDFAKELEESYKKFDEEYYSNDDSEDDEIWSGLKEKMSAKETISVKIKEAVKGGVVAYVDEQKAFIPASQLSDTYVEKLDDFVGQHLNVRITDLDREKKRIILSARVILNEKKEAAKKEAMGKIRAGQILDGQVESIQPYGAFVKIGDGISGLLHISQICDRRIANPREVLKEGQQVKVKVLKLEEGKISLTMKDMEDRGWTPSSNNTDEDVSSYESNETVSTSLGDLLKNFRK